MERILVVIGVVGIFVVALWWTVMNAIELWK
jgi:hypothetical protein